LVVGLFHRNASIPVEVLKMMPFNEISRCHQAGVLVWPTPDFHGVTSYFLLMEAPPEEGATVAASHGWFLCDIGCWLRLFSGEFSKEDPIWGIA